MNTVKVLIHDLSDHIAFFPESSYAHIIAADGKYAPCQGCFGCWTKHPAQCYMKDSLQKVCRILGSCDEVILVTENCYGSYSPAVKNILDRSIGISLPFGIYRNWQMHHPLRYGKKKRISVYAYGPMTAEEEECFRNLIRRNALNFGYQEITFRHLETPEELEGLEL